METVAARCPGLMKRVRGRPRSAMKERKDTVSYAARVKGFSRIRMTDESFRGEKGFNEQIFGADEQVYGRGPSD